MSWNDVLAAIEATPVSRAVAESDWIFPTAESLHVIAITLVVGSILVVDLRLLGLAWRARPARDLEVQFLPVTWLAFAGAALTGSILFLAKPVSYAHNPLFIAKLALLGLAAVNMVVFHWLVEPAQGRTDPSSAAKVSGLVSLGIWIGVVALGRWIGFTL